MTADRDNDDTGLVQDLLWRDDDSVELLRLPHDGRPPARRYVQDLIHAPALVPPDATAETSDDLRTAARKKLAAAGLYADPLAPISFVPTPDATTDRHEDGRLRSWKLPARMQPGSAIYDNLAPSGASTPHAEAGNTDATASAAASPETSTFDNAAAGIAPSPLDHPDARTGLALTAADALLRRGVEAVAELAGGNRPLLQQIVESAVAWLGSALPPEYKPSAAKTGEAALADANRRIDERDRSTRARAALGTLANRRVEAEKEHVEAVIAGDPAKLAEVRREAIDAWRAERRARGDGEAEINAGARAFEGQHRQTAIQHRVAQLPDAEQERFAREDPDAKADPPTTQRAIEESRRIRRDDPARAGHASVEREIERRKREGLIDTPEEETATRYRLRLEAQTRRGIPEDERRLLTNDERTALLGEYRLMASTQGEPAADIWLRGEASKAGTHAKRFESEMAAPPKPQNSEWSSDLSLAGWPRQLAELPTTHADPRHSPSQSDSEAAETDGPVKSVGAEDRRQPEPPITSYSVGAEFGVEQPTSPLRELRKLIGRIRSVAAFNDAGAPLMSDDEVASYIEEARKYIRPEYQDIFDITVLAVRSGMIPWWRALERLREYYAPESTGEAILDGILDVLPVISQVKGTIEIAEALDGLRIAVDEGDEAGAAKFATEAGLLIAGLIPFLKAGKFAKHIPGIEKLKDILGEFAGGRLPFHKFHELWDEGLKLQKHHSFPIFLGGPKREGLALLRKRVHGRLHTELNEFLQSRLNAEGRHMRPLPYVNKGGDIRDAFPLQKRLHAMADFYNGPGNRLRYRNAQRAFFEMFPELRR